MVSSLSLNLISEKIIYYLNYTVHDMSMRIHMVRSRACALRGTPHAFLKFRNVGLFKTFPRDVRQVIYDP